jgi:hypothetical protein
MVLYGGVLYCMEWNGMVMAMVVVMVMVMYVHRYVYAYVMYVCNICTVL